MQFGHDELGVFGYVVNSGGNSDGAVSLERQPRTEMLRREPHRVLAAPQREDRPVPNCHPDPNDFRSPTRRRRLDDYRIAMPDGRNVRPVIEFLFNLPGFLSALKGGEEPGRATGVSGPW